MSIEDNQKPANDLEPIRKISDIELVMEEGKVQWRIRYEQGPCGDWNVPENLPPEDRRGILRLKAQLEEKYGEGVVNKRF